MFTVAKSPTNEITLSNTAAVNSKDHQTILKSSKYVKLNGRCAFKVTATDGIAAGSIGLGGLQREWISSDINKSISVSPTSYDNDLSSFLYQIIVEVSFYPRDPRKPPPPYDSEQMADVFRDTYIDVPFSRGQVFVIQPESKKPQLLRARVLDLTGTNPDMLTNPDLLHKGAGGKGKKRDTGVLKYHTQVKFEKAENTTLHLTGSCRGSSTQPSIISPDWDFSQMGIGGLDKEFSTIFRRAFASRVFPAELVEKLGVRHVKGMLLFGPPGTGKTLLARQIGKMLNARELKIVNGPEILNKYVGESEANIRKLFTEAEEEQTKMGSASGLHIIIFDEIDAICKERGTVGGGTGVHDTVVNQLLAKLDGVEQLNNVLLIGMTNRRDLIDDALLRPGRLDVQVEIGLPDKDGRFDILSIHTAHMRKMDMLDPGIDFNELAERTRNFSGAEIEGLVKTAANTAMNRLIKFKDGISIDLQQSEKIKVVKEDFEQALLDVKPAFGVSNEQLDDYISNGIIDWSPTIEQTLEKGRVAIRQTQYDKFTTLTSLLIHGKPGCGKTALAAQLAQECGFPFVKIVTPEHMIGYTENGKCQAIKTVFDDAYKSPLSCVIVDDIDQLLDYNNVGPRFSNIVFQTLKVLVKKRPPHNRKLLIIGTTSIYSVLKHMGLADNFSYKAHVPYITETTQVLAVLKELGCYNEEQMKAIKKSISHIKDLSIGIKKLIMIVGASLKGTDIATEVVFASMLEEEGCGSANKLEL